jgi:ubiquinone/menaquinone biosynthesis C-methylase UbiE
MSEATIFLSVIEAYDRWSSFYDNYDNPMVFGANYAVQQLAEHVVGQDVIEFGCGTGRNLRAVSDCFESIGKKRVIAPLVPATPIVEARCFDMTGIHSIWLKHHGAAKLVGCDLSAGMLERARARDPELLLLRQDIKRPLPLADNSADLVLFSLTLEHVDDLITPLREASRLVRPTGKIALIEIHPFMSLGGVAAHFRDKETIVEMPTFPHGFSDYLNAAAEIGLRIGECREWRPRDFHGHIPNKVLKRGPDFPLLVEFSLRR